MRSLSSYVGLGQEPLRRLVAQVVMIALLVSGLTFVAQEAEATTLPTVTNVCRSTGNGATPIASSALASNGYFEDGTKKLRITPIFAKRMYVDGSRNFNATYIGYRVTNTATNIDYSNLTVELTGFTGGVVSPATEADSFRKIGSLSRGATVNVYFLMKASGPTAVNQRHDFRIYTDNGVTKTQETACFTNIEGVQRSIAASPNKVTSIEVVGSPALGQTLEIIVKGTPGKVGAGSNPDGSIMALSPASYAAWPTKALQLENVSIVLSGIANSNSKDCENATNDGYGAETLAYVPSTKKLTINNRLVLRNFSACANTTKQSYEARYVFRVVGVAASNPAIFPLASISSGTQIKYTGTLPASTVTVPLTSITYPLNLLKEYVSTEVKSTTVEITYRLRATTTSASLVNFQEFIDAPSSGATFVSATFSDSTRSTQAVTRTEITADSNRAWRFVPATGAAFGLTSSLPATLTYVVSYSKPGTGTSTFENLGYLLQNGVKIGSSGLTTGITATIDPSGQTTITTVRQLTPQKIVFTAPPTMGVNASEVVSPFSDSGLDVTLQSLTSSICTVSLSAGVYSIFAISEGTCRVSASQAGNDQFSAADPVEQVINVLKGQIITDVTGAFGGGSTTTVQVEATSKLSVTLVSLDPEVCTVSVNTSFNASTGQTIFTITKGSVSGICQLAANQPGDGVWGPAPERIIQISSGSSQFLRFESASPTMPGDGYAATVTNFTVTFSSYTTNTFSTKTNLPVALRSLTPSVCVVYALDANLDPTSGFASGNTTLRIDKVSGASGVCTIQGSQDGIDDNGAYTIYAPASNITQSFTIKAAGTTAQTVTFDSIATKAYGDTDFDIFANSLSSGSDTTLLVTIASDTESVCTVGDSSRQSSKSKALLTIRGAGTCTLSGTQGGNSTYSLASGTVSFTVSKKTLTVAGILGVTREFDGTRVVTVSGTPALSGVIPGDGSDAVRIDGTATVPPTSSEDVGTYSQLLSGFSLLGSKASSSYLLTQPTVSVEITPRQITIKFNDTNSNRTPEINCLTRVAVTVGTLVAGHSVSAVVCNLPAYDVSTGYSNGTSTVTPSSATIVSSGTNRSSNYAISFLSGSFIVDSKTIVALEAPDLTVLYGGVLAALETTPSTVTADTGRVKAKNGSALVAGTLKYKKNGAEITSLNERLTVGNHTIEVEFTPTDTATFQGQTSTREITVRPRKLKLEGLQAVNKTYDANRSATISGSFSVSEDTGDPDAGTVLAGDTVSIAGSASGEFTNENVGNTRSIIVTGLSLSGAQAANYRVRIPNVTANIVKRPLKLKPSVATYSKMKGAADPSFSWALFDSTSFASGESEATLGGVSVQRAAGTNASLTPYSVFISVGSASGKDNYEVVTSNADLYIADASIGVTEVSGAVTSDTVVCSCEGFKPGSTATLTMFSTPVVITTAVVRNDGTCPDLVGDLPEGTTGSHTLKIDGIFPNDDSILISRPISFTSTGGGGGGGGTPTPTASPTPTPTPSASPTPTASPRPTPTVTPLRPFVPTLTPQPSASPTPSPSAKDGGNVAQGSPGQALPTILGPTRFAPPTLPGSPQAQQSGSSQNQNAATGTFDFGAGIVPAPAIGSPATDSLELATRTVPQLAAEVMEGFARGAGLRIEVLGARTGARFVLADLQNVDALVTLRAIEASLPAQSADFSQLTAVRRGEQPKELESWSSQFREGADRFFEAVGLEKPVGLYEVDLTGVKTWLTVEAEVSTYQPGSTVFLVATSSPIVIGLAEVDRFGNARLTGNLPVEALGAGEHRIRIVGTRALDGVSVDEDGQIQLSDAIMVEIQRFDLGTQSTVALSGLNPDGGFHSAIRVVPLEPTAPWWSLIFIPIAFLVAGFIRRRSEDKSFRRLSASALGIVISAIPAVILGWFSTVTSVVWVGLAVGLALAAISWFLPAKKVSAGKNQKSKRAARK